MCECGKLFGLLEELQKLIKTHLGTLYIQMQMMFLTADCCFSLLPSKSMEVTQVTAVHTVCIIAFCLHFNCWLMLIHFSRLV